MCVCVCTREKRMINGKIMQRIKSFITCMVAMSYTIIALLVSATANRLESGEKAAHVIVPLFPSKMGLACSTRLSPDRL